MPPVTDFSIDALLSTETGVNKEAEAQLAVENAENLQKPGYAYHQLITMAIERSPQQKLKLNAIVQWIAENFPYYRRDQQSWQNQVRHTLTTNDNFTLLKREPGETGRGDYWILKSSINQHQATAPHNVPGLNSLPVEAIVHGIPISHPDALVAVYFPTETDIQRAQQIHYYQQQYMATAQYPNMPN